MNIARTTSPAIAFAVAAAGVGLFSLMDAAMKDLSIALGAYNAVLWRNLTGCLIAGALFVATGQSWPSRSNLRLHLWRSFIVAGMAVSFFWAIARLPLAEAIGLSFIAPVIALYLAAILLGEKIGREAILASVAGLGGVAIILFGKFSGHYSQDACDVSQFELQLRCMADLPLTQPRLHSPAVMLNLLGDLWFVNQSGSEPNSSQHEPAWHDVLALPGTHLHLYGKREARVGRKMGHLNITAATSEAAHAVALQAATILGIAPF